MPIVRGPSGVGFGEAVNYETASAASSLSPEMRQEPLCVLTIMMAFVLRQQVL